MRKWILIIVALLIAAPFALVATVLYTPFGLSMITSQLPRLQKMGIRIEGVTGQLNGPLHIKRFELDKPNVHIVSNDIYLEVRMRELLLQTVGIATLRAHDTLVEIRNAPPTPPSTKPMRFLPSFMRVVVHAAEFNALKYVNIDGTVVEATRLTGDGRIGPRRIRVREFHVEAPRFNLDGSGRLLAQRPLGLEMKVNGDLRLERGTEVSATVQTSGDVEHLNIQASFLRPDRLNASLLFTRPNNRWHLAGHALAPTVSLQPWMEKPPFSLRNIDLKFEMQPSGLHAVGNVGVPEWSSNDFTLDAQGRYAKRRIEIDAADVAVNDSPVRAHVSGTAILDGDAPTLDVKGSWTHFQWPLAGAALMTSANGNMTLSGPMPYDYTANGSVSIPSEVTTLEQPLNGDAEATGIITHDGFTMQTYTLRALAGTIAGSGSLQFSQPRAWTLQADAKQINPVQVFPQFDGSLDFALDSKGQGVDKRANFNANISRLSGTLRNETISGRAGISRDRAGWHAKDLRLALGDARVALNGTLNQNIDVQASLHARSLQTLLPEARGRLEFTGTATGPVKAPHVIAQASAQDLSYGDWRVAALTMDGDVDLAGKTASRLTVNAERAGTTEPLVSSLRIDGHGVAANHQITIQVVGFNPQAGPVASGTLQLNGKYEKQIWSGTLRANDLRDGRKTGTPISMPQPANFLLAQDRVSVDKVCLALGRGQFCGDGKWQRNGAWEATVSGYEIPLALVLPPSGPETEYGGRIEGRVHVSGAPAKPWLLDAGARIIDAAIIYKPPGADPETLNLGNGGLAATATADRLNFQLGIQAFEDTYLYANAHIERNGSNDLLHLPLKGDIRARAADANILPIIVSEVDNAAGLLTANVDLRGTLAAPQISGRIELSNGAFDSYRVNLALRDLNLVADLANNGLDFRGTGKAGEGQLNVDGNFLWENRLLKGDLRLRGENLLVSDLPEYRVVASPNLNFKIDGQTLNVSGEVTVPTARIQPANLGGAVRASNDARYVGESEAEQKGTLKLHSEVRINMGDDVRVDAFGLKVRVLGGVGTIVDTGQTPVGRGELSVDNGLYAAYGQSLNISRGRLLFDATPLDDPGLDIEAKRKIENITVGMNVRGTLQAPRLTFFSDPSMPQTSIVSYLLVGKGIDSVQSSEATTVGSATDAIAAQGGGFLASRLGHQLGLEQVGVESTTDTSGATNTSLVLGKFLSPRLFISYGISLTESINTFKLRYTVSDNWMLKLEAGEIQSADAEYTIER
ncbi:MAG: translocation/assembly module TamB domain-containing protein [Povalibacter sp.]